MKNEKKELKRKEEPKVDKEKNKTLAIILIISGMLIISVFAGYLLVKSGKNIEYKGVKFNVIQEGKLTFYNTQIPVYSKSGKIVSMHNFYLRTNPEALKKISFEGEITPMKLVAINYSQELDECGAYGFFAVKNIIDLYELIGSKVSIDKNATCDTEGRYMFLNIQRTNENRIEEAGPNCYNLYINDCDVFPTTEKFMIEIFAKINEKDIRVFSS